MLLIFGSEGNIGRRLRKAFPTAVGVDMNPGADIQIDLTGADYASGPLGAALARATGVIHLATSADPDAPASVHLRAVANTARLVEACAAARVARLLLASSDWAEPTETSLRVNAYGYSKRAIEAMAAMYNEIDGLHAVALRFGWVPGSDDELRAAPAFMVDRHWSDAQLISRVRHALGD